MRCKYVFGQGLERPCAERLTVDREHLEAHFRSDAAVTVLPAGLPVPEPGARAGHARPGPAPPPSAAQSGRDVGPAAGPSDRSRPHEPASPPPWSLLAVSLWPGRDGEPLSPQQAREDAETSLPSKEGGGGGGQPHRRSREPSRGGFAGSPVRLRGRPHLPPRSPHPALPDPSGRRLGATGKRPPHQPYSPVGSRPPGSHLKTQPTPRLPIGSGFSANGLRPFWPRVVMATGRASLRFRMCLQRRIRFFLLLFLHRFLPFLLDLF